MEEKEKPELLHRDDLPMDVAEGIVDQIQKLHPGVKVVFAGDLPTNDPDAEKMRHKAEELHKTIIQSFVDGECFSCGAEIPMEWPPEGDDWDLPDGWHIIDSVQEDGPMFLECPECD